ncbi:MAG: hypothetical protein L0Y56_11385, partial [Nitrospira sp.]|nr:hypothetical protein [Nitrospira sp.]
MEVYMLNLKPHKVQQDPKTRQDKVIKVDPYIRLSHGEQYTNAAGKVCYRKEAPVFLQGGRYYSESGEEVKKPPEWVTAEMAKIGAEALSEAGFAKRRAEST